MPLKGRTSCVPAAVLYPRVFETIATLNMKRDRVVLLLAPADTVFQTGDLDYDGKTTNDAINSLYPVPEGGRAGVRAIFVKTDVTQAVEVENLVKECVRTFGRLDVYVHSCPVSGPAVDPVNRTDFAVSC